MTTITGLTDQPKQQSTVVLPDGSQVSLYLEYRSQSAGWVLDVAWQTFGVNGLRLTASPNVMRKWQNIVPFGLAVLTAGNAEPVTLAALADGTTTLLLLDPTDIAQINATAYPGN